MLRTHKDLDVWKKSIGFVTSIYKTTKTFPRDELYGLVSQQDATHREKYLKTYHGKMFLGNRLKFYRINEIKIHKDLMG